MKSYVKKNNFSLFGPKNVTSRNILTQNIGLASPYVHVPSAPPLDTQHARSYQCKL